MEDQPAVPGPSALECCLPGNPCQFPEQAELCFHVGQVGDVAACPHLLGTCILLPYNHSSFHHKTAFVFLIIFALPIFSVGLSNTSVNKLSLPVLEISGLFVSSNVPLQACAELLPS